jgi:adenylate cyclase
VRSLLRIRAYQAELAQLNQTLEARVQQQVDELERVGRLRRFLSPQLADLLLSSGDDTILENHRRQIAVAYCRLPGFTTFAETTAPEEVMTVLGEYHRTVGELIHRFGGTVGAFAGDAIQVFFNDPLPCADPAVQAVRMALAIRQAMLELCHGWAKRGYRLGFGAAVTLGYATLGQIGFAGRVDYAAVGPVVDLADQLSAGALPGELLITQTVYAAVETEVEATALGERSVPGFSRPIDVFKVERASGHANSIGMLSSREREVAVLVARGLTNRQIAEQLVISERTAEGHVDHIRDKLGVHTRAEIAVWVTQTGLAPPP